MNAFLPNHYQHCYDGWTTNLILKDYIIWSHLKTKAVASLKRPNPPSCPTLFLDMQHLLLCPSPMCRTKTTGSIQMSCPSALQERRVGKSKEDCSQLTFSAGWFLPRSVQSQFSQAGKNHYHRRNTSIHATKAVEILNTSTSSVYSSDTQGWFHPWSSGWVSSHLLWADWLQLTDQGLNFPMEGVRGSLGMVTTRGDKCCWGDKSSGHKNLCNEEVGQKRRWPPKCQLLLSQWCSWESRCHCHLAKGSQGPLVPGPVRCPLLGSQGMLASSSSLNISRLPCWGRERAAALQMFSFTQKTRTSLNVLSKHVIKQEIIIIYPKLFWSDGQICS